ncbi:MAG TPA: metallophosphoesterase, partial [Tepidisphaeraceae bacterium]|nr:metallophosphoesterase [Tepidisphaeraceae bacterium]
MNRSFSSFGFLLAVCLLAGARLCLGSDIPLVDYDETWFFHKGTNAPQSGWQTIADSSLDASWASGMGGFGYADNNAETNLCQTLLPDMMGNYTTLYLRKQFSVVSSVDTNLHLMLTMDWDDGFIAWLDGHYLTNALVTGAPAEPPYTATASGAHESSHGNSSPRPSVTYDFGPVGARLGLGPHTLAIMGLNQTVDSSDFIQLATLYLTPAPIVSHGDTWLYRKGTNAPQSDWKTVDDASLDATWASGPGGFGFADNSAETALCQTLLTGMRSNYTTLYMRQQFTTSGMDTNLHLFLTMDWDDGFIAWLDGNYLVSEFVSGAPAEPAYNAVATADHESSHGNSSALPPTTHDLGAIGTRLSPGKHTLAIMGLNSSRSSSDFIQVADLAVAAAPPPPPVVTNFPPGWRFIFFGDARGNSSSSPVDSQILGEIARAATNEQPAFILFSGDLVYDGSLGMPAFQLWTNAMSPVYRAGIPVYPIMGNHDAQGIGPATFTNLFGPTLPANGPAGEIFRTYSFVHSNALVLALDNYIGDQGTVNQPWINAQLATNRLPHIFSFGHVSAFQVTTDHRSMAEYTTPALRDAFWNSLRNAGSKMYICGHYHFYDHARIDDGDGDPSNDLHQFVLGAGGAPPMTDPPTYPGSNAPWIPRYV